MCIGVVWLCYGQASNCSILGLAFEYLSCQAGCIGQRSGKRGAFFFIRRRKYDGTRMTLQTSSRSREIIDEVDKAISPQEIMAMESGYTAVLRRLRVDGLDTMLAVRGGIPTLLRALDIVTGETINCFVAASGLSSEGRIDKGFQRKVDVTILDSASNNKRAERHVQQFTLRAALNIWCAAHRKTKVPTQTFEVIDPFASRLISMALSLQGATFFLVVAQARRLVDEWAVVYLDGVCDTAATVYRLDVYRLFLGEKGKRTPGDAYHAEIVQQLWNGDIRKRGTMEHYCRGCCSSVADTKK